MLPLLTIAIALAANDPAAPLDRSVGLSPRYGPQAASEYDPFRRAVLVSRFSFEEEDDLDYDGRPDDWSRRTGVNFPNYVRAAIDRTVGEHGKQSLEIEANGGSCILYSPPIPIDPYHSWLLEGSVRTQRLANDAAIVSVSLLNGKRQRVQRVLSQPVTGNHAGWATVRIGPVAPRSDVRYVVLGCHLASGKSKDIGGAAWFDNLRLLKLPQLRLVSNYQTHFRRRSAETEIRADVGGLDEECRHELHLEIVTGSGRLVAQTVRTLTDAPAAVAEIPAEFTIPLPADTPDTTAATFHETILWKLPSQDYGYYEVRAALHRDGEVILREMTAFTVLDLVEPSGRGEFGWAMDSGSGDANLRELADVAAQSGINWVKHPVWQSVYDVDKERAGRISEFFDLLSYRGIVSVGVLNDPPSDLRGKFARDWAGISELFTMPQQFWSPPLEPALARFSTNVQYWQMGSDADGSFVGLKNIRGTLREIKQVCDRVGRDCRLGVRWSWEAEWPPGSSPPNTFLVLDGSAPLAPDDLTARLLTTKDAGVLRWVTIRPLSRSDADDDGRAADIVRRITSARIGGAEGIFAADVFDPNNGLLRRDGSPTRLYLPWRTAAVALQGATYLGSLALPNRSTNHVFARKGEVVLVVWNDQPVEESVYLGEDVVAADVWGRQTAVPVDPKTGTQMIRVTSTPLILRGCSEPVARWRIAAKFEKGRVPSAYGEHQDAIVGVNTFPQGANGTVTVTFPSDWQVDPRSWPLQVAAGEQFRLPLTLGLPPNASLGRQTAHIEFDIVADRPYKFRVSHTYEVGLGDVHLAVLDRKRDDGRLEIEQVISNQTSPPETLNFRCSLFVPGHRRQILFVTKLGQGQDRKFYSLPDAESLRGKELWIRAEQIDGRRVLNYKWKVGHEWDAPASGSQRATANLPASS